LVCLEATHDIFKGDSDQTATAASPGSNLELVLDVRAAPALRSAASDPDVAEAHKPA
jgi:hypothetical protein